MYRSLCVFLLFFCIAAAANAQEPADQHAGHTMPDDHAAHAMTAMTRSGSGTAWQPDQSPMYAIHRTKGPWAFMFHENVFVQFLRESGDRGTDQFGSINWAMAMAQRNAGSGRLGVRAMFSAEPATIRDCGYPDLLATGEVCRGEKIHDRQHPHDVFMELAADYDAPLRGTMRWQVYGGVSGEPALGPVAYPHRVSAMANPLAPIGHHWLDSTHVTFGVVTGGVYGQRWKAEASAFNGREPDEARTTLDLAALDSFSGRAWYLPNDRLALQVSAGRLAEAEAGEDGEPRIDVSRITASIAYHRPFATSSLWATTAAWGRNSEAHHASHALLVESTIALEHRHALYGRFEIAGKTAHDLVVPEPPELFTVAKLQGGYTRYLAGWNGFQPGIGVSASMAIVPDSLAAAYGSTSNAGFGVYLTLRPAAGSN